MATAVEQYGIGLDGVVNARELGGYRIGDRMIVKDTFLRTGRLDQAQSAAGVLAEKYRLLYIADFRMSEEQESMPDIKVPGCTHISLPVLEQADMDKPDPEVVEVVSDPDSTPLDRFNILYKKNFINNTLYVDFLCKDRGKKAYRGFFEAVKALEAEEGRSLLWHCTDGKDRTGLASMLLLSALGASRETIMEDYIMTNIFNGTRLAVARKEAEKFGFSSDKTGVYLFMAGGVIREFMEHAIDTLEERYGSVRGYLSEELGVSEGDCLDLRECFLRDVTTGE
ncbi:MAG: tyrosine-protein phosphatase [Lachnospiraceae bacterium]|nr:tyrosine-protein phosphatase [Lachnospiraceae bacterium]